MSHRIEDRLMSEQPSVELLRATYDGLQCHGVVTLIDFLASPVGEGITQIGSSCIRLNEIIDNPNLTEEEKLTAAWFQTRSLYIGCPRDSITPLQWLEKLASVLGHVPEPTRVDFDRFCNDLAWSVRNAKDVTMMPL